MCRYTLYLRCIIGKAYYLEQKIEKRRRRKNEEKEAKKEEEETGEKDDHVKGREGEK